MKTEEGLKNYYVAEYLKEVGLLNKEDLNSDYPVKPFKGYAHSEAMSLIGLIG